ncbi:MAG: ATP-binding protein [Aestuariivita sp.]|nr:ATP-binding protein [Aestuariivita sp.]MCY4346269.1 ATP-binding protein [Aestuariivita sp.]
MAEFRKDKLNEFILQRAKSHPPVFAGRREILKEIAELSNLAFRQKAAIPGNTHIIYGAPGAGKSSILRELELRGQTNDWPGTIYCSNVEIEDHLPDVLKSILLAAEATEQNWQVLVQRFGSNLGQRIGEIQAFGFGIDVEKMLHRTWPNNLHELREVTPATNWKRPVIIAVDEAQRLGNEVNPSTARFLQAIHDAEYLRLPITLVLAGLSDTKECAREMGLTNTVYDCSIGCFTPKEQREVIEGFCRHFGIEVGAQEEKLYTYFAPTDGWPRHMYWAQKALAMQLILPEVGGCLNRLSNWQTVEDLRDQYRIRYYKDRTSNEMKESRKLLGGILSYVSEAERKNDKLFIADIYDILEEITRTNQGAAWRLPESHTARSYVSHLIHQGALQEDSQSETLVCPIPNFQSHLIAQANFTPEENQQLQLVD